MGNFCTFIAFQMQVLLCLYFQLFFCWLVSNKTPANQSNLFDCIAISLVQLRSGGFAQDIGKVLRLIGEDRATPI